MINLTRIYHPEWFQGNLKRTHYFEGWYFKQVSADFNEVLSIIPGVSLTSRPHAFIQVINGITGATYYLEYPVSDFKAARRSFNLTLGANHFSPEGIRLDMDREGVKIKGELLFSNRTTWPRSVLAPGIMGWYSFVPYMECYHGVVSVDHTIQGTLTYNGSPMDFSQGRGYIEKDWGTSMPESWIWLHANTFQDPGTSVMLSIAKIPWRGSTFTGFLCFLLHEGRIYRFMTYNRSRLLDASLKENHFSARFANRNFSIQIEAIQKRTGELKAPVNGLMDRYIKESIDSDVTVTLLDSRNNKLFNGQAVKAGLELVGDPGELLR